MSGDKDNLPSAGKSADVQAFLDKLASTPAVQPAGGRGRLMFAMDATASREPTWDNACHIQGEMFLATEGLGGLEVQLVFYRGFGECKSSPWVSSSVELVRRMTAVSCLGGRTQIGKVLKHALRETDKKRVNALVFVGDCIEEDVDKVCDLAGRLGVMSVPMFAFQEGDDPAASRAFAQFAKLTGGAHCRFDQASAAQLKELLAAVAVYASGGRKALVDYGKQSGGEAVALITSQVK